MKYLFGPFVDRYFFLLVLHIMAIDIPATLSSTNKEMEMNKKGGGKTSLND
jgi:hypothetical protein